MHAERDTPAGVSKERLQLAVKGDPTTGERVPLTYGADPAEAAKLFHQFQGEVQAVLRSEGITDATIVQLGSGTTGWSTAPGKTGKAWRPESDADFAIFSDQMLQQARELDVAINPKNEQGGRYTTLKSTPKDGRAGMYDTSVGQKLKALALRWDIITYGKPVKDGFDFKLNLSNKPFSSATKITAPTREVKP